MTQNLKVKDGGTIGSASATDAMTVASTGIVTFKDDIVLKDAATIGVASSTSAISIASTGIVTFVDDIVVKDGGTIGVASDTDAIGITSTGQVDIDSQLALGNTNFTSILSANGESTGTGVGMTLRAGTDNSGVGGNAIVFGLYVGRAANSTYTFLACGAGTSNSDSTLSDPTHKLLGNGATNADGAYSSTGADYAEMFEWEDGNSSN